MVVTVLGSGTSHGVPMIGCRCEVCTSADPRDQRTRASIFVRYGDGVSILVDTSPELRVQCVANGVDRCDAILMTHHHADHITGMDDVRRFNWMQRSFVPVYGQLETLAAIRRTFAYAFEPDPRSKSSRPMIQLTEMRETLEVGGHVIRAVPLMHGEMPVLGFRFGRFAYCTDVNFIPDSSMSLLRDLDVLILDGLRYDPHPMHFSIAEAIEWAARIGAGETYLTHLTHAVSHARASAELPRGVGLAYDGQFFELDDA